MVLLLIQTPVFADETGPEEDQNGLYHVTDIVDMYMNQSSTIKIKEMDQIIKQYTLLNGELDLKNLEQSIISVEKSIKLYTSQIETVNDLIYKTSPGGNTSSGMTSEEKKSLHATLEELATNKSSIEESMIDLRSQLELEAQYPGSLTPDEVVEIQGAIDLLNAQLSQVNQGISEGALALSVDSIVSEISGGSLSSQEQQNILVQKKELVNAKEQYQKELVALKRQKILLTFQNTSHGISYTYSGQTTEASRLMEVYLIKFKLLKYRQSQSDLNEQKRIYENISKRLAQYEMVYEKGYMTKTELESFELMLKESAYEVASATNLRRYILDEILILTGIDYIEDIIFEPDSFEIKRPDLLNDEIVQSFLVNNSDYLILKEQILAYEAYYDNLKNAEQTDNDKIIAFEEKRQLIEQENLIKQQVGQYLLGLDLQWNSYLEEKEIMDVMYENKKSEYSRLEEGHHLGFVTSMAFEEVSQSLEALEAQQDQLVLKAYNLVLHYEALLEGYVIE